MTNAIKRGLCKKKLSHDRLGDSILISYDESKRMMALCIASTVRGILLP
jgi:hypothetical protein